MQFRGGQPILAILWVGIVNESTVSHYMPFLHDFSMKISIY